VTGWSVHGLAEPRTEEELPKFGSSVSEFGKVSETVETANETLCWN